LQEKTIFGLLGQATFFLLFLNDKPNKVLQVRERDSLLSIYKVQTPSSPNQNNLLSPHISCKSSLLGFSILHAMAFQGKKLINDPNGSLFSLPISFFAFFFLIDLFLFFIFSLNLFVWCLVVEKTEETSRNENASVIMNLICICV
jgi:hypothetical protein